MALNESVVEAVANANFKTLAEQVASNTASHQQRLQILAETSLARSIDHLNTTSVPEGLGMAAAQRGDLAKQITDLAAAVSSMQASVKAGQTVPPVTA